MILIFRPQKRLITAKAKATVYFFHVDTKNTLLTKQKTNIFPQKEKKNRVKYWADFMKTYMLKNPIFL